MMKKLKAVAAAALVFCYLAGGAAIAQPATAIPPERIKLDLDRSTLALIAQGVMKLPYEQAAPILNELQRQLEAQQKPTTPAAPAAPAEPAK